METEVLINNNNIIIEGDENKDSELLDGKTSSAKSETLLKLFRPTALLPKTPTALSTISGCHTWMIPKVICTPQRLFHTSADVFVDMIIKRINHHFWEYPTILPEIITPST